MVILWAVVSMALIDQNSCSACISHPTPVPTPSPSASPSASPSPISENCALITRVRITTGSASCTLRPGNVITVGCQLQVSATPLMKDENGVEIPAPLTIHGSDVEWSGASGVIALDERGTNRFNRTIRALARGPFVVLAENCKQVGRFEGEVQ